MADFPSYATLPTTGSIEVTMAATDNSVINRKRFYLQRDGYNTELREFYSVLQNTFSLSEIAIGDWTLIGICASGASAVESASASVTVTVGTTTATTLVPASGGPSDPASYTRLNRGNAYGWLGDFDSYFATRYGASAWEVLSDSDKEKLIITATSQIDNAENYIGGKLDSGQLLEFPRFFRRGSINSADEMRFVPREVFEAVAEQALHMVSTGSVLSTRKQLQAEGVTSISIGQASESYGAGAGATITSLCAQARSLLAPWTTRLSDFGGFSPYVPNV